MIAILLNVLLIATVVLLAVVYTRAYLETDPAGTWSVRLLAALKKSYTIVWASAVTVSVALLDLISTAAVYIDAGYGEQIKAVVKPEYTALVLLGFAAISIIARLRTLWRN